MDLQVWRGRGKGERGGGRREEGEKGEAGEKGGVVRRSYKEEGKGGSVIGSY